jgi:mRNA interferase RelE/StbE
LGWSVEYTPAALRHLKKLDKAIQAEIVDYMDQRIAAAGDPSDFGKPLRHAKFGLWRYRVHDYRVICELDRRRSTVVVLAIGHRSTIYQ